MPVDDLGEPASPRERGVAITETGKHPTVARSDAMARPTPSAQFAAPRPLILASQALRRELAPASPAARPVQVLTAVIGLGGLIGTWLLCGPHALGLPVGGALLALAVLGLVPMPYPARATSLATVSGSALAVVTWHRVERANDLEPLVLVLGVVLLASALLFRGWHRASLLARALVGIGIALCAGWLWTSQALQHLLVLESQVQAWLQPVLAVPFGLLMLLALLAFMDSRTTGGCALWGALVLGWYCVHDWAALAVRVWPAHSIRPLLSRVPPEVAVTWFAAPLFAAVLAAALSQLLAVATSHESQ